MIFMLLVLALVNVHFVCAGEADNLGVQQFNSFKTKYNKTYASLEEEKLKMQVHKANVEKIANHNKLYDAGQVTFKLGMNHLGDMSPEEFKKTHLTSFKTANSALGAEHDSSLVTSLPAGCAPVPEQINWANKGAVTPVKDQGQCGSCWAFANVAVLESHYFIHGKEKKLESLSEQNVLDCVGPDGSCDGGTMTCPLEYVLNNHGIATEEKYPYKAKQGKCQDKCEKKVAAIKGFMTLQPENEKLLKGIVGAIGPVTCAFDAEDAFMQFYESGIYTSKTCSKTNLNHAVAVVGYGRDEQFKMDYWILKNSWTDQWGEKGYFRMRRGRNECGIAVANYYPVV